MTRMMLPAATVAPEKMRSPGRCLARILGAAVAVTGGLLGVGETGLGRSAGRRPAPTRPTGPRGLLDGGQSLGHAVRQVGGEGSGAGGGRCHLLALAARDVADVG